MQDALTFLGSCLLCFLMQQAAEPDACFTRECRYPAAVKKKKTCSEKDTGRRDTARQIMCVQKRKVIIRYLSEKAVQVEGK